MVACATRLQGVARESDPNLPLLRRLFGETVCVRRCLVDERAYSRMDASTSPLRLDGEIIALRAEVQGAARSDL